MKIGLIVLNLFVSLLSLSGQTEKRITIIHTNDLHSRLMGYAPESEYSPLTTRDDATVGGFARIATIIRTEKESNNGTTLVLDAGDFMMGTLFPSLEMKSGFQLRLMKEMGYDVLALGNHEFEFGPEWLASVVDISAKNGRIPALLIGNANFDRKDNRDDLLEKEFSENLISRKLIMTKNGTGMITLLIGEMVLQDHIVRLEQTERVIQQGSTVIMCHHQIQEHY